MNESLFPSADFLFVFITLKNFMVEEWNACVAAAGLVARFLEIILGCRERVYVIEYQYAY